MIKKFLYVLILLYTCSCFGASQQASSTDASVIATRARAYLNDPTTWGGTQKSIWSDTELLQWVNDGTNDIVARTQCLEDIETETLVANTYTYALTTNFIAIKAVIYKDAAGNEWSLEKGNYLGSPGKFSFGHSESMTGSPAYFIQWENSVIVYPIPDATAAGDTIDVYMVIRPTAAVGATDDVKVPAYYDRALTLYVVIQALYKDGQFNKAARIMTEYLAELDRYRADYTEPMPKVQ